MAAEPVPAAPMAVADVAGPVTPPLRCLARAEGPLKIGDRVEYWSATHGQWLKSVVLCVNTCEEGRLASYHLDVKRSARPESVRSSSQQRDTSQVEAMCSFGIEVMMLSGRSSFIESLKPWDKLKFLLDKVHLATGIPKCHLRVAVGGRTFSYKEEDLQLDEVGVERGVILTALHVEPLHEDFAQNDLVEYWSKTHDKWMKARIVKVHADGERFDLDVKRNASWRQLSRPSRPTSSVGAARHDVDMGPLHRRQRARAGGA